MVLGYNTVESCGLVVFNGNHVLLIKRNGKWDLPKGKLDDGEGFKVAAKREVEEECGIAVDKVKMKICATKHTYDTYGELCLKKTALRETDEETGLRKNDLDITTDLFPTQHFTQYDDEPYIKTTHWFLAKYRGPQNHILIPQEEEGIEDVKWISLGIINQYLPEMRGYARYILNFTLKLMKM